MPKRVGISNRKPAKAESKERQEYEQTSRKAGTRSTAQKETGSRYPDRSMPAWSKVAGAFGKEDN